MSLLAGGVQCHTLPSPYLASFENVVTHLVSEHRRYPSRMAVVKLLGLWVRAE
jgi:hypothetical protein